MRTLLSLLFLFQLLSIGSIFSESVPNLVTMIEIIRQRRMNLRKREIRKLATDFLGSHPVTLVVRDHVLNTNASTSNDRPLETSAVFSHFDILRGNRFHTAILPQIGDTWKEKSRN